MSIVLDISQLVVAFGGLRAVDGMDLRVSYGEAVAVIGPNGAGKSTLVNAITGFADVAGGQLEFKGASLRGLKTHQRVQRGMTRTFQNLELFETMTVRDNLLSGLRVAHKFVPALEGVRSGSSTVERISGMLGLTHLLDAKTEDLPYGTRKLTELGRALIQEPLLLLLDEPAAGLGPTDKRTLVSAVQSWRRSSGGSFVLIEHDMALVKDLADRVVVMELGKEIASGSYQEVARNPDVVKAYLGTDAGVA